MAGQPLRTPSGEHAGEPWRSSLDALEAALAEAARAITELRFSLEEENTASAGPVAEPDHPAANEKSERLTVFERVWQRLERKRKEPRAARAEQDDLSKPSSPSGPVAVRGGPEAGEKSERLTEFERVWQSLERERKEPRAARAEQDDLGKPSGPSGPVAVRGGPEADEKSERLTDFERVWQRLESERKGLRAAQAEQDNLSKPSGPSGPVAVPDHPEDAEAGEKSERKELRAARAEQDNLSKPSGPSGPVAVADEPAANEKSERVWQRLERKRKEPHVARAEQDNLSEPSSPSKPSELRVAQSEQDDLSKPSGPSKPSEPRGLDLLPKEYLMTIEDRDARVDLTTLQRGLLTLAPMEDIRLVTYAKGVPVISLRVEGELDLERLSEAVGNAIGRRCEVIPQDGTKLFLRLTPNDDQEEEAT